MFLFETPEGWFFAFFGALAMISFISWILFARLSMARIDRTLRREGKPNPCPWDFTGARALWYAYAIVLPVGGWNQVEDPLIDVLLVRRYATRTDRILGAIMMASGLAFSLIAVLGGTIFGFY